MDRRPDIVTYEEGMGDQSAEANKDVQGYIQGPSSSDSVTESPSSTDIFCRLLEESKYPEYFRLDTDCVNALRSASVSDSGHVTSACYAKTSG